MYSFVGSSRCALCAKGVVLGVYGDGECLFVGLSNVFLTSQLKEERELDDRTALGHCFQKDRQKQTHGMLSPRTLLNTSLWAQHTLHCV